MLFVALSIVMCRSAAAAELPKGFSEAPVVTGLSNPTAMQLADDGRLFVCEQNGRIRIVRDGRLLSTPFATLPVHPDARSGVGIALDPAFASNGFVYVYYTAVTPVVHDRVSRLTAAGDTAVPGSEKVLLALESFGGVRRNIGGGLRFGPDRSLYIATGDHGRPESAQSFATHHGKVLRINADGSTPTDNPRSGSSIWARGLRAPSIGVHSRTGAILINDAGRTASEVNSGSPGANYGWPARSGSYTGGAPADPLHVRAHPAGSGCGIRAGAFYDPDLAMFPAAYHDAYFIAEPCSGSIAWLNPSDGSAGTFGTDLVTPIDLLVSPDGALYYLSRGTGRALDGAVYRIVSGEPVSGPDVTSTTSDAESAPILSAIQADVRRVVVSTTTQFRSALGTATAGTVIALNPGVYSGGNYKSNLAGTADQPIVIEAADPASPPVIRGGGEGLKLSDARYVTLRNLIVEGQTLNGINIDDLPGFSTPSHHIILEGIVVRNLQATGNVDGIKLSGVQDFLLDRVTVVNWATGGSGVDMVGCHRGEIRNSTFRQFPSNTGGNGIQAKGGSTAIVIRNNRFEHAAARAVQLGGPTTLTLFRPQPHAAYEASNCLVERNVFVGGETAVAFVNLDGSTVRYNTIYKPTRWAIRILQENRDASMVPSRRGVLTDNILYGGGAITNVNVGAGTDGKSFTFARNWWYRVDAPGSSRPILPSPETAGVYGVNPQFVNADGGDLRLKVGSPATAYGAYAVSGSSSGTGLRGEYYNNSDFTALFMTRTDLAVNFNWSAGAEPGMGVDTFSIRWTGRVQAPVSETFTFYTQSDDGVRLWVNGVLLIDNWTIHALREDRGSIALIAGQSYDIRVEYFEAGGPAAMRLAWSSPSMPKQIVPKDRLFGPAGTASTQ
jgi:glucose/arabinose dehydrogenase